MQTLSKSNNLRAKPGSRGLCKNVVNDEEIPGIETAHGEGHTLPE
jgi:hypothetical protein